MLSKLMFQINIEFRYIEFVLNRQKNIKNSSYKIDFASATEGLKEYANNLYGKSDTKDLKFKDSQWICILYKNFSSKCEKLS